MVRRLSPRAGQRAAPPPGTDARGAPQRPQSERPRSSTRGCCRNLRCVAVSMCFGDFAFEVAREVPVVSQL
jgi:hypothetical protein